MRVLLPLNALHQEDCVVYLVVFTILQALLVGKLDLFLIWDIAQYSSTRVIIPGVFALCLGSIENRIK